MLLKEITFLTLELNLATNHLSSLPEELRHLEDLTKLDISHNHFKELPQVVYRIDSLKELSAEENEILGMCFNEEHNNNPLPSCNFLKFERR